MKKLLPILTMSVAALAVGSAHAGKLSIAATPVPHAELLEFVKPVLAELRTA